MEIVCMLFDGISLTLISKDSVVQDFQNSYMKFKRKICTEAFSKISG